jgi:hypothetical protein
MPGWTLVFVSEAADSKGVMYHPEPAVHLNPPRDDTRPLTLHTWPPRPAERFFNV